MLVRMQLGKCRHLRYVAAALFLLPAPRGIACAQQLVLTKAAQVHDLPGQQAQQRIPVHLVATVTYYEPSENTLFVEDSSGAVYVKTTHPYPLHRGDLVQVDGFTAKSFRTTVGPDPSIRVIGTGSLVAAKIGTYKSYKDLMAGRYDCQYVLLRGTVRSALVESHGGDKAVELEVLTRGGIVQAYIQDYRGLELQKLMDSEVEVPGVVGGDFNARWQLMRTIIYSAAARDMRIVRKAKVQPLNLPLTPIDNIVQTRSINDRSERVRVTGTLTYYRPGNSLVVQQNGLSLFAATRQNDPLPLGSVVDLVGFADDSGYGPALGQAEFFPTGRHEVVQPTPISYAQAISAVYSDNLISVRGRIISQLHTDSSDTLILMVDNHPVTVLLQVAPGNPWLPPLPLGAEVSVTGICRVTPSVFWGTPGTTPMLFRLDMRSVDDLRILTRPSWWTVTHLLLVLGALLIVSILIAAWAMILRKRVAQQTASIERTIRIEKERGRLLELINSETPLETLLEDICNSIETLVPELVCFCTITSASGDAGAPAMTVVGTPPAQLLVERQLTDSKGQHVGTFGVRGAMAHTLSELDFEVVTIGAGLANLAVNQRRLYEELNYRSTHDQLTALPNRRRSDSSLELALQQATQAGTRVGVAYIDVDRFKLVNDAYGHKVGDLYLQQIASRLASEVRRTDELARIGGDEFLLIATALQSIEDAEAYKHRLESCFEYCFVMDGARVHGSASIGIAVFPEHGSTAEELKRHADFDMYSAKSRRRAEQEHHSPAPIETGTLGV